VSDIDWSGTEDSDFRGSMLVEGALTAPGKPAMVVVRVQGAPAMFNSTTVYVHGGPALGPKVKEFSGSAVRYQSSCLTRSYVHS